MPVCSECTSYRPIDESSSECFGNVVSADQDSNMCPMDAFQPMENFDSKKL